MQVLHEVAEPVCALACNGAGLVQREDFLFSRCEVGVAHRKIRRAIIWRSHIDIVGNPGRLGLSDTSLQGCGEHGGFDRLEHWRVRVFPAVNLLRQYHHCTRQADDIDEHRKEKTKRRVARQHGTYKAWFDFRPDRLSHLPPLEHECCDVGHA